MASAVNVADHESVEEYIRNKERGSETDSKGKVPACTYGFDIQDRKTDLILIIEDRRLYVNRGLLEFTSSIFGDLFKSKLKGKDTIEVEIPDANYNEFAEFLACMYPTKQYKVSETNVFSILPLAFHYKVDFLLDESEAVLRLATSQTEDEGYLIKCLETAKRFGLTTLRQHCFDMIVKNRRENVHTLDKEINTDDKMAVYDELMPHLRSEVCKLHFLSSAEKSREVQGIVQFSNAKYKKEQFSFLSGDISSRQECLETEVWGESFTVTVDISCYLDHMCMLTLTSSTISNEPKSFGVAINFVFQNNIPGKQNRCCKGNRTMTQGSEVSVQLNWGEIKGVDKGFRWNDKYTVVMHILVDKPVNQNERERLRIFD